LWETEPLQVLSPSTIPSFSPINPYNSYTNWSICLSGAGWIAERRLFPFDPHISVASPRIHDENDYEKNDDESDRADQHDEPWPAAGQRQNGNLHGEL